MITWKSRANFKDLTIDGPVEITFGYNKSEIEQDYTKWLNSIYKNDKVRYNQLIDSLSDKSEIEIAVNYRVIRKDGEIRDVVGIIKKVNIDGITALNGYIIDLNHLKSVDSKLSSNVASSDSTPNIYEKSDRLKRLFHDLMTPISTIELNITMIEQLSMSLESEHIRSIHEKIQRISRSVIKLKSLLGDRDKY